MSIFKMLLTSSTSFLAGVLFLAGAIQAAQLTISNVTIAPGVPTAQVAIRFASQGEKIVAMQGDIVLPAGFDVSATTGQSAIEAGKQLSIAAAAAGRKRFILAGLNQSVMADGVVIHLSITIPSNPPAQATISLVNASAADASGRVVPLTITEGTILIASAPNNAGMSPRGSFAHFASGGTWKTTFLLLNRGSIPISVRLRWHADDGSDVRLPVKTAQPSSLIETTSSLERAITPAGILLVETEADREGPTISGWATLEATGEVSGYAIFRQRLREGVENEAVVPLESGPGSVLLPFDHNNGFVTGLALANSSDAPATIMLLIRDENGNALPQESVILGSRTHASFVLGDRIPSVRARRGTIEFMRTDGGSLNILGLRFNPFGSFTTIPFFR